MPGGCPDSGVGGRPGQASSKQTGCQGVLGQVGTLVYLDIPQSFFRIATKRSDVAERKRQLEERLLEGSVLLTPQR